jgi:hypothetical protein
MIFKMMIVKMIDAHKRIPFLMSMVTNAVWLMILNFKELAVLIKNIHLYHWDKYFKLRPPKHAWVTIHIFIY